MSSLTRRDVIQTSTAAVGLAALTPTLSAFAQEERGNREIHLAPFRFDVTPPMGHSMCGGWIKPAVAVDDPLEAVGFVLTGLDKPVVLCAVDWTGLLNSANLQWRQALAEAAGTTADRVAVHCVHQHNAPFACLDAQSIVGQYKELPHIVEVDFFRKCLDRARSAVKDGLKKARRVTHVARGQGKVEKVASNRRVSRSPDGKILRMRGSSLQGRRATCSSRRPNRPLAEDGRLLLQGHEDRRLPLLRYASDELLRRTVASAATSPGSLASSDRKTSQTVCTSTSLAVPATSRLASTTTAPRKLGPF